jgi:hypothetical protein
VSKVILFLREGKKRYFTNELHKKKFFCSTLSEFENFLLCERILINVTTVKTKRQANFKDFKGFGAFKGLVEQKKRCIQLIRV